MKQTNKSLKAQRLELQVAFPELSPIELAQVLAGVTTASNQALAPKKLKPLTINAIIKGLRLNSVFISIQATFSSWNLPEFDSELNLSSDISRYSLHFKLYDIQSQQLRNCVNRILRCCEPLFTGFCVLCRALLVLDSSQCFLDFPFRFL